MKRSFSCGHCRTSLRLKYTATGIAFVVAGLLILLACAFFGTDSTTILFAVTCLSAFFTVLLFIPLEEITDGSKNS